MNLGKKADNEGLNQGEHMLLPYPPFIPPLSLFPSLPVVHLIHPSTHPPHPGHRSLPSLRLHILSWFPFHNN